MGLSCDRLKLERLDLLDVRDLVHLGEPVGRHRAVDLDQRDGVAAFSFAVSVPALMPAWPSSVGEAADEAQAANTDAFKRG